MAGREIPQEILIENTILLGYRGSVAHNLYIPNTDPNSIDDIDLMGVFVAPPNFYLGIGQHRNSQTKEISKEIDGMMWDCVYYELQKFVRLLLKGNPNVLSLLWLNNSVKPTQYLKIEESGAALLHHRKAFLNRKAIYDAFTGYADGQLKRMENFNLYAAHGSQGYMGAKRKRLVKKYGYDIKNAGHLIRLLSMGIEFLKTGELKVFRDEDREKLLDIKTGKWSLEQVKEHGEELSSKAEEAYANSVIPCEADRDRVETMVMITLFDYLTKGKL